MALRFTDLNGNVLFEFKVHEYPEKLPWNYDTKLNEIQYPDNHYTNQILGTKLGEIEFSGTFYGTYWKGADVITAWERSEELMKLENKVVVINYAVGGQAGPKETVIIKCFKRDLKNYYDVDYTLTMVPHEPQTRVKPSKVNVIDVSADAKGLVGAIQGGLKKVGGKLTDAAKGAIKQAAKTPGGVAVIQHGSTAIKTVLDNAMKAK